MQLENPMLRVKAHRNKILFAIPMLSGLIFGNIIQIARCHHHTGNKYGRQKSRSSFSLTCVAHIKAI